MLESDDEYEDPPLADGLISFLLSHKQKYEREGRQVQANQIGKYMEWVEERKDVEADRDLSDGPAIEPPEPDYITEEEEGFPGGEEFMRDE